jgi:hypothetical protein
MRRAAYSSKAAGGQPMFVSSRPKEPTVNNCAGFCAGTDRHSVRELRFLRVGQGVRIDHKPRNL